MKSENNREGLRLQSCIFIIPLPHPLLINCLYSTTIDLPGVPNAAVLLLSHLGDIHL